MQIFARIDGGVVVELIELDDGCDVADYFTPQLVESLVNVSSQNPQPSAGWVYDANGFSIPVQAAMTADQIKGTNTRARDDLLNAAGLSIDPLQDAVDLGIATSDEAAQLTVWKQYRVAVGRVDLSVANPVWPSPPGS